MKKNLPGCRLSTFAEKFNKRFRLSLTETSIKTAVQRRGIKNGCSKGHDKIYTDVHINWLRKNVPGTPLEIVSEKFNKRFCLSSNVDTVKNLSHKYGIKSRLKRHQFPKGNVPFNKGRKGYCAHGCEVSWFTKGHRPANWRPVGSERTSADGYVEIKVTNKPLLGQKRWRLKHVVVFEKENGPVPKGHCVIFLDGNKNNITLDNLCMITRQVHAVMCHMHLFTDDPEITMANCILAANKVAVSNLKKKTFTRIKSKKIIFLDNNDQKVYVIHNEEGYISVREKSDGKLIKLWGKEIKVRTTRAEAQHDLYEYAEYRGWMRI
ncbi:MAG: HNH endonuclease [Treponema sp.]|nr:HNH endonuclease [Treponema sp.]